MPVKHLARSDVVTAPPDESVRSLAESMADESVGSVMITDDSEPVGIVTDRDLALRALAEDADPDDLTAADVLSPDLYCIEAEQGFYRAAELMSEHAVRRLPVVDSAGKLSGIITVDDLHELLADEHQLLASVIQRQRPPY